MTKVIGGLSAFAREILERHSCIHPVAPKTAKSKQRHLSVYQTAEGCTIGVELDHTKLANLWIPRNWVALARLEHIKSTLKVWTGDPNNPWQDAEGKGANSNLRSYDGFQGQDLVRFGIRSEDQFRAVMAEVLR